MTILVTGGNGQLGSALRLASAESRHRYIFTGRDELDITSAEEVEELMSSEKVDVVINCAAYTAVDLAEDNKAEADEVNHKAVAILAEVCKRHDATLIHISTDYLYSGDTYEPYTEDTTPAPLNAYGRTKLAGEMAIAKSGCRYIILRTAWLYSEFGNNFVKKMCELFDSRDYVLVVADQIGTPTYARDLAEAIVAIIESEQHNKYGIYHYSNIGECSWFEFATEIARLKGESKCDVLPCATASYPTKAVRPEYTVLDKGKFLATFGIAIPEWQESLAECLKHL